MSRLRRAMVLALIAGCGGAETRGDGRGTPPAPPASASPEAPAQAVDERPLVAWVRCDDDEGTAHVDAAVTRDVVFTTTDGVMLFVSEVGTTAHRGRCSSHGAGFDGRIAGWMLAEGSGVWALFTPTHADPREVQGLAATFAADRGWDAIRVRERQRLAAGPGCAFERWELADASLIVCVGEGVHHVAGGPDSFVTADALVGAWGTREPVMLLATERSFEGVRALTIDLADRSVRVIHRGQDPEL